LTKSNKFRPFKDLFAIKKYIGSKSKNYEFTRTKMIFKSFRYLNFFKKIGDLLQAFEGVDSRVLCTRIGGKLNDV
jgi:hypothetical protein